jgi:hypothetical protein
VTAWKQTYTGGVFLLDDPQPEQVRLADVAHSLALTCRFGGHCREFYSVAQHSVLMARASVGTPELALAVLLHDAAEAYTGDLVAPVKRRFETEAWRSFEDRIDWAVGSALGGPPYDWVSTVRSNHVKDLDRRMLAAEARLLMVWPPPWKWGIEGVESLVSEIAPWGPELAEREFVGEYARLTASANLRDRAAEARRILRDLGGGAP